MSIQTVEIRAFAGPATVELAGIGVPEIVEVRQGPPGLNGPNSVTSATTSDGTCDLELHTLRVDTISEDAFVATSQSLDAVRGVSINGIGVAGSSIDGIGVNGGSQNNIAILGESGSGVALLGQSNTGTGLQASSVAGVYSAEFQESNITQSAIERARGWFVWFYNAFTGRLKTADITANRDWTLPDRSGNIALTEDYTGGTATIDVLNATVQGTLTASHIHGNIAGSVYAHVRAGEALAKGDPVYISGSHGSGASLIAIVSKADASNAAKMPAVGIMDAAVANNANGHMVITGSITELDTNAYAVNTVLYVASGGGFTATPPAANSQPVAIVERANTTNGAVIVKVNGLASSGGNGASDANKLARFSSTGGISQTGGTMTNTTYAGTASFTSTTRPTSAGTGAPAATSLITLNDWAEEQIWNMYRLPKTSTPAITQNGATTALNSSDGIALRIESANTAPRPVAAFNRIINRNPAVGNQNVVTPMRVATMVAMGVGNENHRIRFFIGGANGTLPPYANEQPISGRGWGWELFYSATNARHEIALFAHDGTTFVRTDGLSGRSNPIAGPTSINQICSMIIGINASGLVSLWANIPTSDGRATRPSATPVLTLAGGPTSGNYGTFGGICCSAVAQSTGTAGAITDIRFESPTIILD